MPMPHRCTAQAFLIVNIRKKWKLIDAHNHRILYLLIKNNHLTFLNIIKNIAVCKKTKFTLPLDSYFIESLHIVKFNTSQYSTLSTCLHYLFFILLIYTELIFKN